MANPVYGFLVKENYCLKPTHLFPIENYNFATCAFYCLDKRRCIGFKWEPNRETQGKCSMGYETTTSGCSNTTDYYEKSKYKTYRVCGRGAKVMKA